MNDRNETSKGDEAFIATAREHFDESVSAMDAATQSRLTQGRHRALAEIKTGSGAARWSYWAPVAGAAAATVFAVVLWRGDPPVNDLVPPSTASDMEILLDQDDFEMLENLEFYSWIDVENETDANVG